MSNASGSAYWIFTLLAWLLVGGPATATAPDSAIAWGDLTRDLEHLRQELVLPGMSVAVVLDEHVAYACGFGLADIDAQIPATENTPYHIASLTKPFSSVLVMRLVEARRLSLDSRMRDLCAASVFNVNGEEVEGYDALCEKLVGLVNHPCAEHDFTIRHHLSHTARGIPGEKYRYTGWLFGMLTEAIEAATGRRFVDLLVDEITGPLELSSTVPNASASRAQQILARRAVPYRITEENQPEFSHYPGHIRAAAGIVSTVLDLARFDVAIDRNVLLTAASTDTMLTPTRLNDGSVAPYALGWYVQDLEQVGRIIWHAGWQPDMYSALYLKVPSSNATFIMLANSDRASAGFDLSLGDVTRSPFARLFLDFLAARQ